jgi:hypothetical protein
MYVAPRPAKAPSGNFKMASKQYMKRSLTAAAAVLLAGATLSPRAAAFKERWHKAITYSALAFLPESVLSSLLTVHDELDNPWHFWTAGVDRWHFNDCNFRDATKHINELYASVLGCGTGPVSCINWRAFGQLLHTAQDFYAHTNWVELGETTLVDSGLDGWKVIEPYSTVAPNVLAVEGDQPGFEVRRDPGSRIVTVELSGGAKVNGLISGATFLKMHCPRAIQLGHWDSREEHNGLAKDYPSDGPGFEKACGLALRQTLHEWCRLTNIVAKRGGVHLEEFVQQDQRDRLRFLCDQRTYLDERFTGGCSWHAPN